MTRSFFARALLALFMFQTALGFVPRTFAAEEAVSTGSGSSSSGTTVSDLPLPSEQSSTDSGNKPEDPGKPNDTGKPDDPGSQGKKPLSQSARSSQQSSSIGSGLAPSTIKEGIPQPDQLTGALNYQYPITTPPGRNGMEAGLALQYASNGNGEGSPFGSGWSVNIPSIQRDNKTGLGNLYTANTFSSSLSGELVNVSGSSYRAKVEGGDFLEYTFSSNAWTVKDKKGTVYKFGTAAVSRQDNPSDSTKATKWMLDEVRDLNDNYVKYEYYKDGGQIYPSKVKYTGNGSTDGIFEVEFLRQSRTDTNTLYQTGFAVTTNYRINEIQVKVSGTWIRKYVLSYANGRNGRRSLLDTITESGRDESTLTQVSFPAQDQDYHTEVNTWTTGSWSSPVDVGQGVIIADLNGDSLPDFIQAIYNDQGQTKRGAYINTGSGWSANTTWDPPTGVEFYTHGIGDRGVQSADLNGDGLADLVQSEPDYQRVYLNTGSGWSLSTTWDDFSLQFKFTDGSTRTDGGSRLLDINGDGFPDFIRAQLNSQGVETLVQYNMGTGWSSTSTTPASPVVFKDGVVFADLNGDGLIDLLQHDDLYLLDVVRKAYINNGNGWTESTAYAPPTGMPFRTGSFPYEDTGVRAADVNGDGLTDLMQSAPNLQRLYLNTGGGWQLDTAWDGWDSSLTFVGNGGVDGKTRTLDLDGDGITDLFKAYQTAFSGIDTSSNLNVGTNADLLKKLTYPAGGTTDVTYKATGKYFSGSTQLNPALPFTFDTVQQTVNNDAFGTTSTKTYSYEGGKYAFVDNLNRKFAGFAKVVETDAAGGKSVTYFHQGDSTNSSQGEYSDHFSKIGSAYRTERLDSAENKYAASINKWDRYDLGSGASFVKLIQSISQTYDGNAGHKDTASEFTYDNANGNLTQQVDWGEVTGADAGTFTDTGSDKLTTTISYASNTGLHILGLPSQQTTTDQSAAKVNESRFYYDSLSLGSVNKGNVTKQEQWKTASTYVNSQKAYNSYGLPTSSTDPRGKVTTYAYDTYNLYPATVTNALSQATSMLYDYSSGQPWQVTDVNSLVFQTYFDGFDRPTEEKQPDQTTPSTLVTKATYAYTDTSNAVRVKKTAYLDASNLIDSYTYFDGLGRPIHTRTEAEDTNTFTVTDTTYNSIEQASKTSLPYFSTGTSRTSATTNSDLYTTLSYDAMYRVVSAANAVGTTWSSYDDWKVTVTDPRGKNKLLHKDALGNLVKVEEFNSGNTYTTLYEYDGNKNLTKITDALSNIRSFTYDGLSRRLTAQDLHASADATFGTWTYAYDDAGNLTQTVDPKAQTVNYVYDDLNRITSEDHTGGAGTEATYAYDTCTRGVGKLCTSTVTGVTTSSYQYSPTGQVSQETENTNSQNFVTSTTYDRQGNVLEITNPDSSKVKYAYNTGGQLETVQRKESTDGSFINVTTDFDYGPHGGVTYQANANGTNTTNTYDATKLYRLSSKVTVNGASLKLQDIAYTYDANGNVLTLTDNSQTNSKKTVTYTYDDLNRLLTAISTNAVNGQNFNETYAYDAIGNITSKTGQGTYAYAGTNYANPHAVTSAGNSTFTYDNNGNVTNKTVTGSSWYSSGGGLAWYSTGGTWTNRKQVTIDYTKVSGGSNLSNFSVLVSVTDATLKTVANGGNVGKSDGTDILFTASDGTTKLSHEIEKYDATTGSLTAWVKVPTLSASANTVLILYYGNASASDQQDKVNTWDSSTKGVWHLGENPAGSAPQMKDSTGSAYDGTSGGGQGSGDSQAGKIGNALNFDGSNDLVDAGTASAVNALTSNFTVSAWIKPAALSGVQRVASSGKTNSHNGWGFGTNGTSLRFTTYGRKDYDVAGAGLSNGTWTRIDAVMSGNNVTLYANGTSLGTVTHTAAGIANTDDPFLLGLSTSVGSGAQMEKFAGLSDEVKVSNTVRSAGWIATEYANQDSPSTFLSLSTVAGGSTWTNRKQVTIDHTKVGGTANLSNFPVLVNVTDASLKTVANGGNVGKTDGTDILFTSSDGTTKLSHEIEKYDGATGNLVAWVKVPTLTYATDTVLLLYYGNASATDQQDKVNVWDSNTKGVWHFNNAITDSTSNANNGTNYSSSNTTSGKIADARDFVSTGNRVTTANTSSLKPTSAITVSAWVKRSGTQVDYAKPLWFGQVASSPWGPYGFQMDEATNNLLFHVSSNTTGYWMAPAAALPDNTWTYVTGTYDGTSVKYYVNGILQSGQSAAFTIGNYDGTNGLGVGDSYASGSEWKGYVDEARISSTARSQDWVTTEYNNQNSPSTFLALSDAPGAGSNTTYAYDYRNRMVTTSGSTTSSYGYDVSGERVKATLGGVTTLSPTRGYSLEGSTPIKQIYAGSMLVATIKGTGAGATVYTVATDHLTGSNSVSNASGSLEELLDYYPYGSVRLDEKSGSFDQKRKFAGHEYDSDTDLSYMVARYYDGGLGRFMKQDPLFLAIGDPGEISRITGVPLDRDPLSVLLTNPQALNSYSYASNNPLAYTDPTGEATIWAFMNPLGLLQLAAWKGVVGWLNSNGNTSAAILLRHSLKLNPRDITISKGTQGAYGNIVDKIQESQEYKDYIAQRIAEAEAAGKTTIDDTRPDDQGLKFNGPDLKYGIHGTKKTHVVGKKNDDGSWSIYTTIYDTYDYEWKSLPQYADDPAAKAGNNLAVVSQKDGVVSMYKIKVSVSTTVPSTK